MVERRFLKTLGTILAAVALVWVLAAFGLGVLLPFLLGYLAARLAEPLVRRLSAHGRLPRWACSGLCVSGVLLVLGLLLYGLGRVLFSEAAAFSRQAPQLLQSLAGPTQQLRAWLEQLAGRAPDGLGPALQGWVARLFTGGSILAEKGSEAILTAASGLIGALPDLLLFAVTAVLASFMISAQLPALRQAVLRLLPKKWHAQYSACLQRLKSALGGWFRAQLKLMGVTFCILTAGFLLLGIDFPLLFAGLTCLIDALPIFGTGTVLIPWAIVCFLRRETYRAVGLLVLYAVASLTRTSLEPRLVGKQLGLNPLLTLLAMYAGFRLCGVLGMILFPIAAIVLRQLLELVERNPLPPKRPG